MNRPKSLSRRRRAGKPRHTGKIVVILLALSVAVALYLAHRFKLGVPQTLVTVLIGGGAPAALFLAWATFLQIKSDSDWSETVADAADDLAEAVASQWSREAIVQQFNDYMPLSVSWRPAKESLCSKWDELVETAMRSRKMAPEPGTWAASLEDLVKAPSMVDLLEKVPTGRLVVLGGAGSGKTMLMIRVIIDILYRREERRKERHSGGDPVPVLVPLMTWDPVAQDLRSWLTDRLTIDYPALAELIQTREGLVPRIEALLKKRMIIPVLDGLDEMRHSARRQAIRQINNAMQASDRPRQLLLTSRPDEYERAVGHDYQKGHASLRGAAVIDLCELSPGHVRRYLTDDDKDSRWLDVVGQLGTPSAIGKTLVNPLTVSLAAAIYNLHLVERPTKKENEDLYAIGAGETGADEPCPYDDDDDFEDPDLYGEVDIDDLDDYDEFGERDRRRKPAEPAKVAKLHGADPAERAWTGRAVAKTRHEPPHPNELTRFQDVEPLKDYLFDAFIAAAYRSEQGAERRARKWLIFAAEYMTARGKPLEWWNIRRSTQTPTTSQTFAPPWLVPTTLQLSLVKLFSKPQGVDRYIAPSWLVPAAVGTICGVAAGAAAALGAHVGIGIGIGFGTGMIIALAIGGMLRKVRIVASVRVSPRGIDVSRRPYHGPPGPGMAGALTGATVGAIAAGIAYKYHIGHDPTLLSALPEALGIGIGGGASTRFIGGLTGGLIGGFVGGYLEGIGLGLSAGILNGIGVGLAVALALWFCRRTRPARQRPEWRPEIGIPGGIVIGLVLGIIAWREEGLIAGLVAGAAMGAAAAWPFGLRDTAQNLKSIPSPTAAFRSDSRTFKITSLAAGLASFCFGFFGGGLASIFEIGAKVSLYTIISNGLGIGLSSGIVIGLTFGFYHAASPTFIIDNWWMALQGKAPWRLMRAFKDAHKKTVLRQSGAYYQFRHVYLQEYLADPHRVAAVGASAVQAAKIADATDAGQESSRQAPSSTGEPTGRSADAS